MLGDAFRDKVGKVLSARFGQVFTERSVRGKAADLWFLMRLPGGKPLRIAVECKEWAKPLSSSELKKIYTEYIAALEAREIDSVWVVCSQPIRSQQRQTIESFGVRLRLFSLQSLYDEITDFSPYLRYLQEHFSSDGLNEYYIMPRTSEGTPLHDSIVVPWLAAPSRSQPLAIVSGYGSGKTSYSRYLGKYLADRALSDLSEPKPIIVRLGDLTKHQTIRGLINSMFSDEFCLDGYNFQVFNVLLQQGAFIIIFDGFDEMKHAMKHSDIVANFNDITEFMRNSRSKYIIMGRPDPFLSIEDELPIRSSIKVGRQIISDPARVPFNIITLDEFNAVEVRTFLRNYLKYSLNLRGLSSEDGLVEQRAQAVTSRVGLDVIRKPVHARMVGILASSVDWKIEASSEYDLYNHFVRRFIERELSEKVAREPISAELRLEFMAKIAWWLWTVQRSVAFTADDVPDELIEEIKREKFELKATRDVVLREMLTGSMLERSMNSDLIVEKEAFSFYFPHRSYWEFLVSEYVAHHGAWRGRDLPRLLEGVSGQVLKFLKEREDRVFILGVLDGLAYYHGDVSASFLATWCNAIQWERDKFELKSASLAAVAIPLIYIAAITKKVNFEYIREIWENVRNGRYEYSVSAEEAEQLADSIHLYSSLLLLTGEEENQKDVGQYCVMASARLLADVISAIGVDRLSVAASSRVTVAAGPRLSGVRRRFYDKAIQLEKRNRKRYIKFSVNEMARCHLERKSKFVSMIEEGRLDTEKTLSIEVRRFLDEFTDHRRRWEFENIFKANLPILTREDPVFRARR